MNWHCVMVLSPDTVNGYGSAFAGIGEAELLPAGAPPFLSAAWPRPRWRTPSAAHALWCTGQLLICACLGIMVAVLALSVTQIADSRRHGAHWSRFRRAVSGTVERRDDAAAVRAWLAAVLNRSGFARRGANDLQFVFSGRNPHSHNYRASYSPGSRQIWLSVRKMPDDVVVCHEAAHHFWEHCATPAEAAALDRIVQDDYLPAIAAAHAVLAKYPSPAAALALDWFCAYGSVRETLQADPDELRADILTYYVMLVPALQVHAPGPMQTGYAEFRRLFRPVVEPLLSGSPPVRAEGIDVLLADGWRQLPRAFLANTHGMLGSVFSLVGGNTMASRRGAGTQSR